MPFFWLGAGRRSDLPSRALGRGATIDL